MSDKKRKATSAPKEPNAKQQRLAPMKKEEKKEKAGGWLQDSVKRQRTENKEMKFNKKRLRFVSDTEKMKKGSEGVLYWMSRDQRVQGKHTRSTEMGDLACIFSMSHLAICFVCCCFFYPFALDNWALVHAQKLAVNENLPLHICVCLCVPESEVSTLRHYSFMLKGLEEVAKVLTSW